MKVSSLHGRSYELQEEVDPHTCLRPNPIITFSKVYAFSKYWHPNTGDRHALLLLKRKMPNKVSFPRAYTGWLASGARERQELGEGRAFLRWLQKHQIAIDWKERDFSPHPYFSDPSAPTHDPRDELAQDLSFAIRPVYVKNRNVKLYLRDDDMLSLLNMQFGDEEDFLELVMSYVSQRFKWENWRAPAPHFFNWVLAQGKRPVFGPGQLGFRPLY